MRAHRVSDVSPNSAAHGLALLILTALAYFASARLGYALPLPRGIVPLWFPAGVTLAFLLLSERRHWPMIVVGGAAGSMASDLLTNAPLFSVVAAGANMLESVVAAAYVRYRVREEFTLGSLGQLRELLVGVIACNAVTAMIGALALHLLIAMPFATAWIAWWVGDGLGMLIVAPPIITGVHALRSARTFRVRSILELLFLYGALAVLLGLAFNRYEASNWNAGLYLTFPFLFWAALRFGPAGAALATLFIASFATWHTGLGIGPFASLASESHAAIEMYLFLLVVAVSSMVPAVVLVERARAAGRQVASDARHGSVVDAATDAIVEMDAHGTILFANLATERIFGHRASELPGQPLANLMPARYRRRHKQGLARFVETGERRLHWDFITLTGLHRDGREMPLEASFGDRIEDGQPIFTGILRDVSEKKKAEAALRVAEERMAYALEAARVGTWEMDVASGTVQWSALNERLHGLEPDTFGGTVEAFTRTVHGDDRERVREALARSEREGMDANLQYRIVLPDGKVRWISGVGRTFHDDDGMPTRTAGVALDVTERTRLEAEFLQSQKMDAVGQLAGGIAHDFNNLLTAILAYGKMLEEHLEPGTVPHEDVQEIIRAGERAAALTRQLLAFSRKELIAPKPINFSLTVRAMEPLLRRLIGEDVDLRVQVAPDLGTIVADEAQLEQVVMNLALNARDAMPQGGRLHLDVRNADIAPGAEDVNGPGAGRYVLFSVADTGVGMSPAVIARIFEPFFTTKERGRGTGLGLSTVYGIVRQFDGAITVESEVGRGSTFRVYLPRTDADIAAAVPQRARRLRGAGERILVVEDDAALRTLVQRILVTNGYDVQVAAAPGEALSLARAAREETDLLLTDVILPEMSGRALAEELVRLKPGLHVLYMSGYTDDAVMYRDVRALDAHFIQKPFTPEQLLEKVRETLATA